MAQTPNQPQPVRSEYISVKTASANETTERIAARTTSPITRPTTDSESRGFFRNESAYLTGGTIQVAMAKIIVTVARTSEKLGMVRPAVMT
jgi:hypothetical protein